MVYDYLITLKKPDYTFVDRVSQLFYLFALGAFGYFFFHVTKDRLFYPVVGAVIILIWIFVILRKRKKGEAFFRLGLLVGAVGWFLGPERNVWMGILYTVAALLEKQVKFPQEIGFSEDEISLNSLPRKVIKWSEVSNVVIKDAMITIDQKNNKLFQKEIEGYVSGDIEKEFNEFAGRCINKTL